VASSKVTAARRCDFMFLGGQVFRAGSADIGRACSKLKT
jgi:hypothetical protein